MGEEELDNMCGVARARGNTPVVARVEPAAEAWPSRACALRCNAHADAHREAALALISGACGTASRAARA